MVLIHRRPRWWPFTAALWLNIAHLLLFCGVIFMFSGDTTIPEGSIVYSVQQLFEGNLYRDYNEPPYATTPYPPLYYLTTAVLSLPGGGGIDAIYAAGRLISMSAMLSSFLLVSYLCRLTGVRSLWAFGSALAAMSIVWLMPWAFTCRPDLLALCLSLLGLFVYLRRPSVGSAAAAAAVFLLAVYTKHSAVSAPAALGLGLLIQRSWKPLITLVAGLGSGTVVLYLIIEWWTEGLFGANVLGANAAPIVSDQPWDFFVEFMKHARIPLVLAVIGGIRCCWHQFPGALPLLLYALISTALALLASLKAGADLNYFIEPAFAYAVFAGRGMHRLEKAMRRSDVLRLAGVFLLLMLFESKRDLYADLWLSNFRLPAGQERVLSALEDIEGDVFFANSGLALSSGRPVLMLDTFNASYLTDADLMDCSQLTDRLRRHDIAAVVLPFHPMESIRQQLWLPRPVAEAIQMHYTYAGSVHGYMLYLPNRWHSQREES